MGLNEHRDGLDLGSCVTDLGTAHPPRKFKLTSLTLDA